MDSKIIEEILKDIEENDKKLFSTSNSFVPGREVSKIITDAVTNTDMTSPKIMKRVLLHTVNAITNDTLAFKENVYSHFNDQAIIQRKILRLLKARAVELETLQKAQEEAVAIASQSQESKSESKPKSWKETLWHNIKWFMELKAVQAAMLIVMLFILYSLFDSFGSFMKEAENIAK